MSTIKCKDVKNPALNKRLVDHLKSEDFFNVGQFKTSTFSVRKFKRTVTGDEAAEHLTIKEISQAVAFTVIRLAENKYPAKQSFDRSADNIRCGEGIFFDNLGDRLIADAVKLEITLFLR